MIIIIVFNELTSYPRDFKNINICRQMRVSGLVGQPKKTELQMLLKSVKCTKVQSQYE